MSRLESRGSTTRDYVSVIGVHLWKKSAELDGSLSNPVAKAFTYWRNSSRTGADECTFYIAIVFWLEERWQKRKLT